MSRRWTMQDVQRVQGKEDPLPGERKYNKYKNKPVMIDGIRFASTREGNRYGVLKLMESRGIIRDLRLQVPFRLQVGETLICTYIADFTYTEEGCYIVEDSKGMKTKEYLLKKKLLKAIKGIEIKET